MDTEDKIMQILTGGIDIDSLSINDDLQWCWEAEEILKNLLEDIQKRRYQLAER